jgi:hypothetical protein
VIDGAPVLDFVEDQLVLLVHLVRVPQKHSTDIL